MAKVKDRAGIVKLSRKNVTEVTPSISKKKHGKGFAGSKQNKAVKDKSLKTPPSPEVQLGLKLDALLAKQTSPLGSQSKKAERKKKQKGKVVETADNPKSVSEIADDASKNVKLPKPDKTSLTQKLVDARGVKRNIQQAGQGTKKSKGPNGKPKLKANPSQDNPPLAVELNRNKVLDIIRNLLKLNESDSKDNAQGSPVFIQLTKRNPITVASKMIRFPVAHSLISENSSVCMIVKDVTDGSEDSVKSVKEKLKSSGIKNVKEVMTLNKFLQVCQSDKNNLCNKFDYFLIDSSISHRSNSRKLRRFSSQLKFPIPVRLYGVKNIKPEVEKGLAKTIAVVTKTPTTTFKIGFTSMTPHQIRDNVYAVWSNLDRLFPGGTANISAAAVKLADSKALSFYVPVLSIQLPKEVTMSTEMMVWKKGQESPTKSSENLNAEKKRAGTEKKLTKNQKKKLKRKARALEKKGSTPNGVEEHKTNATTSENVSHDPYKEIMDEFIARSKATRPKVVTKPYEKFSSSSSDEYLELSDGGEEFSGDDVDQFLDLEAEESSCDEETDDKDEESLSDSDVDEELDEDIFDGSSDSESDEEGDESDNEVTASISPKSMKKIINTVPAALKKGKQGANKKFESNGKKKPFMKKAQNAKGLHQNTKRSPQQFGKKKKGKSPMK